MAGLNFTRPGTAAHEVAKIEAAEKIKREAQEAELARQRTEAIRFWLTFSTAALAALAAIAGVVLQCFQA